MEAPFRQSSPILPFIEKEADTQEDRAVFHTITASLCGRGERKTQTSHLLSKGRDDFILLTIAF